MNVLPKNIIITAEVHPFLIKELQKNGLVVIYEPSITYKSLSLIINQATGLVVTTRLKIDKLLLSKAKQLKWIGRLGSGMELIDEEYANEQGVVCYSTPEGNRQAVAEHCLGLLLNLYNNITKSYLEIKEGFWFRNENRGNELYGKTVGIIGYGNAGSAFAAILSAFNVTVLAYDKYKTGFGKDYIKESNLDEIAENADIISFHVPLTSETKNMVNSSFLDSLQKQPLLINACRGGVVNTNELIKAIKNEQLCGVALDVLENEKIDLLTTEEQKNLDWLLNQTNVIITPHIAGYTHEAFYKMSSYLLQKLNL